MRATLLFIHGRSQASRPGVAGDPARVAAFVETKKRSWLAGLATGLITAGLAPADESRTLFPFYADILAARIAAFRAASGRDPDLEIPEAAVSGVKETRDDILFAAADALGFDAARELTYSDPEAARELENEFAISDVLKSTVVRTALQFLARKTGAPTVVIEQFLDDVAFYLRLPEMRETVLGVVRAELERGAPGGGDLVVVGHSLGSVVAYDLLTTLPAEYRVRQFVTAGSPLGYPVVQRHLIGSAGVGKPVVPAAVPGCVAAWLNAYDVLDVVALLHPLAGTYTEATAGQLTDTRTFNAGGPHSISDYLSDPDVAGPIGRALAG